MGNLCRWKVVQYGNLCRWKVAQYGNLCRWTATKLSGLNSDVILLQGSTVCRKTS